MLHWVGSYQDIRISIVYLWVILPVFDQNSKKGHLSRLIEIWINKLQIVPKRVLFDASAAYDSSELKGSCMYNDSLQVEARWGKYKF